MARSPSQTAGKPGVKKTLPRLIRGLKRNEYRTRALYFEQYYGTQVAARRTWSRTRL